MRKIGIDILSAIFLAAFALVIYQPSFKAPFHMDDLTSIVQNRYIRITSLTPHSLLEASFQDYRQNRPLGNLSFALNYYFNQVNPFGYHLVNFCIFILTALGIWLLSRRLMNRLGFDPSRSNIAGWLTALVWTAHPANVQAVTYIVQRHASMAGMFSIWSIYFFHTAMERKTGKTVLRLLSGFLCLLAMLSKETALTLPAIILVYKIYFFDDLKSGWLKRNWKWMLALAVFYLAAAGFALRPSMRLSLFNFSTAHFTGYQKVLSAPRSLFWYIPLIIFPFPQFLSLSHEFTISTSFLHPAATIFSWLALLLAVSMAVFGARRWKVISFAIIFYLAQLLIEAMPLPIDLVNEHRLYLAMLSIIIPAVGLVILKPEKIRMLLAFWILIAAFFGFFTWQRNRAWGSETVLWKDVAFKAPSVARWWNYYCSSLIDQGEASTARPACEVAVRLDPGLADAHLNLGVILLQSSDFGRAEKELGAAVRINSGYTLAYFNLGLVRIAQDDVASAKQYFQKVEQLGSRDATVYFNMGLIYEKMGDDADALRLFKTALSLRPEWFEPRLKLAYAFANNGMCRDAVDLVKSSPANDPRFRPVIDQCRAANVP